MAVKFTEKEYRIPEHDHDLMLRFPSGKTVILQFRPGNADLNYNGSFDIILPENTNVNNWEGDDMKPAKAVNGRPEIRFAKQLVMELP